MNFYEIYVDGDPYDTVFADSPEEAVEFFKEDYPECRSKCVSAYELLDCEE